MVDGVVIKKRVVRVRFPILTLDDGSWNVIKPSGMAKEPENQI